MTVKEAIERACTVYPEAKEQNDLYTWLSEFESRIQIELNGKKSEKITSTDGERELSAPDAYAEIYPLFLITKTNLANHDTESYNNFHTVFVRALTDYTNFCTRKFVNEIKDEINYYTLP